LPVRDDSVIAATRAFPCDPLISPQPVLDHAGTGLPSWAPAALDPLNCLTLIVRSAGCRDYDGRKILRQSACGTGNIRRKVTCLVDEVTQVGDPRHAIPPSGPRSPAAIRHRSAGPPGIRQRHAAILLRPPRLCLVFQFSSLRVIVCPPNEKRSPAAALVTRGRLVQLVRLRTTLPVPRAHESAP